MKGFNDEPFKTFYRIGSDTDNFPHIGCNNSFNPEPSSAGNDCALESELQAARLELSKAQAQISDAGGKVK